VALVFHINEPLIQRIMEQDISREIYASFKDLEKDYPPKPALKSEKIRNQHLGVNAYPSLKSLSLADTTVLNTFKQNQTVLETETISDCSSATIIVPPPGSVVAVSMAEDLLVGNTSSFESTICEASPDSGAVELDSNFDVPIITSVSSLMQPTMAALEPEAGHLNVFEAFSTYAAFYTSPAEEGSAD
jgi:hypothetical protein